MRSAPKILAVLALLALCPQASAAIVMLEDFEDAVVNFTTSSGIFHDGNQDYYTMVPLNGPITGASAPYLNNGGTSFFAAEDIDDGNSRPNNVVMTFEVNIANTSNLAFSGLFAAAGNDFAIPAYDNNGNLADDFLRVTAQIDAGATQNLFWMSPSSGTNEQLFVDSDFNGIGGNGGEALATRDFNDQTVSNLPIAGTGNTLFLRIELQSNDGNTEFAWDNIQIDGDVAVPEPSSFGLAGIAGLGFIIRRRRRSA
ncbi:MAG: PEP-CTERM sorting domain-containing protein [Planctomycetota bacterium]